MNLEEIKGHVEIKLKFNNYPTVPSAAYAEENSGHKDSVIRGFKKRVAMWLNDHKPALVADEDFDSTEELETV